MPQDYRDGVVRYVILDDIDVNPWVHTFKITISKTTYACILISIILSLSRCCGTHHHSLAFLNTIFIFPNIQLMSGPPRSRLYFAVGDRVLSTLSLYHSTLKDTANQIGCGLTSVPERVDTLIKAKKEAQRREKVLRGEASRALAGDLKAGLKVVGGSDSGVAVGRLHREEESTDIEFLTAVLREFVNDNDAGSETTQIGTGEYLVILSSGPILSNNNNTTTSTSPSPGGCLIMAGSSEAVMKKSRGAVEGEIGWKGEGWWGERKMAR